MDKIVIFAFNGELMCFAHALLNALDLKEKGYKVKLVIEGSATKLITDLDHDGMPFNSQYKKAIELGIVEGICKTCAMKMGTLEEAKRQGLKLLDDMNGHPSIEKYIAKKYNIITL